MQEVGGAVQGVDHPDKVITLVLPAFFGEYRVLGISGTDDVDDFPFGGAVYITGKVVFAFLVDIQLADVVG